MKKLMLMSFSILCIVLAVLSYINFSYDGLDVIEKNKQKIVIDKEKSVSNEKFLKDIESVLNDIEQDIMYRYVDTSGDKPHYKYYKTNHTEDFIEIASSSDDFRVNETESISTCEQKKYKTSDLLVSSVFQDISFYNWHKAETYDLSSCTYYIEREGCDQLLKKINDLGYKVELNSDIHISGKMSVILFAFIPAFLFVISMVFYSLSNAKSTVIKKMDGYAIKNIFFDEITRCGKNFCVIFFILNILSLVIGGTIFRKAVWQYMKFSVRYYSILSIVFVLGISISILIICMQNKVEYVKGKVPKKGIYYLSMLSKCIFVAFVTFFLSIAIRNIQVCYSTYSASRFLAEKVEQCVTIPINENNSSSLGLENNYLQFYKETVDKFNGILIDVSNYEYDITSGKTLCEEFDQDSVVVNNNYLEFNPIYDDKGEIITLDMIDKSKVNILLPISKKEKQIKYEKYVEQAYRTEASTVFYDDKSSTIYSYNSRIGAGTYGEIKSPVILVVQETHLHGLFVMSYCSKGGYFLQIPGENPYESLKSILEKVDIEKVTPQTPYISSNFDNVLEQQFKMLLLYGSQTLILTIGLICIIIYSSRLYFENYRHKVATCICEGYSLSKCVQSHIVFIFAVYVMGAIGIYIMGKIMNVSIYLSLIVVALVIDLTCTLGICRKYATKNIHEVMKGAE